MIGTCSITKAAFDQEGGTAQTLTAETSGLELVERREAIAAEGASAAMTSIVGCAVYID